MARFALLLNHAPDRYARLSEDEAMTIFKDYMQWMEKATSDGICTGGYKLVPGPGKTVTAVDGEIEVHESPFAELPEILGGWMVIEASDYRAAVEIARTHPHLMHNKTLEIRQLEHE